VVHPGDVGDEGQGSLRGLRLARHVHPGRHTRVAASCRVASRRALPPVPLPLSLLLSLSRRGTASQRCGSSTGVTRHPPHTPRAPPAADAWCTDCVFVVIYVFQLAHAAWLSAASRR
jgi:hypothetical protein